MCRHASSGKPTLLSVAAVVQFFLQAAPWSSSAFVPRPHPESHNFVRKKSSNHVRPFHGGAIFSSLHARSQSTASGPSLSQDAGVKANAEDAKGSQNGKDHIISQSAKEVTYAAILKAIDESHYNEANQLCSNLASETAASTADCVTSQIVDESKSYYSPTTRALSDDSVNAIRKAARSYFEKERERDPRAKESERVDLGELISSSDVGPAWENDLNYALIQTIYPLIRSGWPSHEAFSVPSNSKVESTSAYRPSELTVTSASVFAGCDFPGADVAMTTFERDAGLFVVHIDLGNDKHAEQLLSEGANVIGALYLESLSDKCEMQPSGSIVTLYPGQMVVHKSMERTAAIVVPSNIQSLEENNVHTLDGLFRRNILKAAEKATHYALRLVLTTKIGVGSESANGFSKLDIPEAPCEERSYRLRSYSRFRDSRERYLTLAGLLDADDYENHLWLGFDYLARFNDHGIQGDQQISFVNKAIFHLEKASALCPTDSRIHFQLATAIRAKMDYEKHLLIQGANDQRKSTGLELKDEANDLIRVADALKRSANLESSAVKVCVSGVQDLAIVLSALAETQCKLGDFEGALKTIDRWAECGSIRSALAFEDSTELQRIKVPSYEWIQTQVKNGAEISRNVAVRTVGDMPVLEPEDITLLRAAADKHFALAAGFQTSRFTMQYEGNSEAHLDDLCADPYLKERMDQIMQEKIYPLVREAFRGEEDEPQLGSLCVYDSIFVRYNGDIAKAAGRLGASQPLHQDGGIYSVNIALNAHKDDDDDGFTGGGTFFEALTVGDVDYIQRPIQPGHAIIHHTTQRHAGAPTTSGVRDILVIFLTARRPEVSTNAENTWRIERGMRLQSIAKELTRDKLIPCLKLAKNNDPRNSEIPYWLGVHLLQGDMNAPSGKRWDEICEGIDSFKLSTFLNPADARAHYHLGMAISTRHKYAMRTKRAHLLPPANEAAESLIQALETAIRLERKCVGAGCGNGLNLAAAFLALGDFMARLNDFDKAVTYLNQVEDTIRREGDIDQNWAKPMLHEVSTMLDYCTKAAMEKSNEASVVE